MSRRRMAKALGTLALAGLVALLAACASSSKYLRSEPATHYPLAQEIKAPPSVDQYVRFHCIDDALVSFEQPSYRDGTGRVCSYVSAEVNPLVPPPTSDATQALIAALVYYSDLNCSNFLHRAFASRNFLDFSKGLIQDIATGASAVTAFSSPAASAILSGTNLVVGKGVSDFNVTYYLEKTFQAMQDAIAAERAKRLALLVAQRDGQNPPPLADLLSLVRSYDDACSIRDGLDQLSAIAQQTKDTNQSGKDNVVNDPKMSTYNENFGKKK